MCKDNIFPEKNNGFQALSGADFLPWSYSAAEKNDYFCDHKIESTMIRQYAGLVKFAHTIFAMPFALVGFVYALRTEGISSDCSGRYGWVVLLLQVLLCMVFARNAAMGFNRWADRLIDNMVLESPLAAHPVVGYENHAGRTYLGEGVEGFGRVVSSCGHGNNDDDRVEGARYKNVVGTYSHGPLLSKNPEVADWLLARALERRTQRTGTPAADLAPLDDSAELAANASMVKRLS